MRVCIDARGLSDRPTGAGKALGFLLRQLRADFPGHDYVTYEPPGAASWRLFRRVLWEQTALAAHARRVGADVLPVAAGGPGPTLSPVKGVIATPRLAPTRHPRAPPHPPNP